MRFGKKVKVEIKATASEHNKEQVAAAMAGLGDLFDKYNKCQTVAEVGEHIARINGYCYALVNMGVLEEKEVNGKIAEAAVLAAVEREQEIEGKRRNGN